MSNIFVKQTKKKRLVTTDAEFVKCEICGAEMKWIQNRHLEIHNTNLKEYREQFPDSPTKTVAMQKKLDDTRARAEEKPFHGKYCLAEWCNNPCRTIKQDYCSLSCSSRHRMRNEELNPFMINNPAYTDGSSASNKRAKRQRAKKDDYTCQGCKKKNLDGKTRKYGVHHIIARFMFDLNDETYKLRDSEENLITLCGSCHRKAETQTLYFMLSKVINGDKMSSHLDLMKELRTFLESGGVVQKITENK